MRSALLLSLLLVASCARDAAFSNRSPGLNVADVALANGAPDTALHIAQHALASNPRDVAALVRMGQAQAMLGQSDAATHSFTDALAIAPSNIDAALSLGRLKLASDPTTAGDLFQRLASQDPRNVAVLIDLGIARDLTGQHTQAQGAYRQALAIEPGRTAAGVNLGLSLAVSGDPQQALTILRPLALGPDASPRVRQNFALALALAGDNAGATSMLQTDIPKPEVQAVLAGYRSLQPTP